MKILLDPTPAGGGASAAPAAPAPSNQNPTPSAPASTDSVGGVRSTPNLNDAFSQLDKLFSDTPPPADAPKPADKPTDTPSADKPPVDKPADDLKDEHGKPMKAATLRQSYDKLKADLAEREARLVKYQEMEKTGKFSDDEKKSFEEKLTKAEARRQELEKEIQFHDFTKSTEYQEKYEKPFVDAYQSGIKTAMGFKITDPASGEVRQGTADDFKEIMAIDDPDAAAAKIEELFGTGVKAQNVSQARNEVLKAWETKNNAIKEFSTKGEEIFKQRREAQTKLQTELAKTWKTEVASGLERLPQIFKPVEGDVKGNEILDIGYKLADLAFNALAPEESAQLPAWVQERMVNGKLPPVEMARLHAAIRNKAGAFDRVVYQNKQYQTQISELQKQLDGFKKSGPGTGEAPRAQTPTGSSLDSIDAQIDRMAGKFV